MPKVYSIRIHSFQWPADRKRCFSLWNGATMTTRTSGSLDHANQPILEPLERSYSFPVNLLLLFFFSLLYHFHNNLRPKQHSNCFTKQVLMQDDWVNLEPQANHNLLRCLRSSHNLSDTWITTYCV